MNPRDHAIYNQVRSIQLLEKEKGKWGEIGLNGKIVSSLADLIALIHVHDSSSDVYELDLRPTDGYYKGFKVYARKNGDGNDEYLAYGCGQCGKIVLGSPCLMIADMSPSPKIDLTCGNCFNVFDSSWF